jgi:hypothetical protein
MLNADDQGDEFDEDGAPHQLMIATINLHRGFDG